MASCRSWRRVAIARIKGGQGGKRRKNGEDLAHKFVCLAVTATATVRIHCTFLLTFQFFLITSKLVTAYRIRSCFLSHSRHSCLDHSTIKLSKGNIIGCNHLGNIFTTPD